MAARVGSKSAISVIQWRPLKSWYNRGGLRAWNWLHRNRWIPRKPTGRDCWALHQLR